MTSRIEVFYTSILSNPKIRSNTEKLDRFLAKVPHQRYDIASDEAAKAMWRRKNGGSTELPMILVDGVRPGDMDQLEEAVEFGELRQFLRLDEAPAPTKQDDDVALADLSADEAARLAAELDDAERPTAPLQPGSVGADTAPEHSHASAAVIRDPGQAEADEFETGMS